MKKIIILIEMVIITSVLLSLNIISEGETSVGFFVFWDGTDTPTGWTCVSCATTDPFYNRFIIANDTYGNSGGIENVQNHTITKDTIGTSTQNVSASTDSEGISTSDDTHTMTTFSANFTNNQSFPRYRSLRVIRYNNGIPKNLSTGMIIMWNSTTAPSNYAIYTDMNDFFIHANNTANQTGGQDNHTHVIYDTKFNGVDVTTKRATGAATVNLSSTTHIHTFGNVTSNLSDNIPNFVTIVLIKSLQDNNPFPIGGIFMFNVTPTDTRFDVISNASNFKNNYLKANLSFNTTGGSASHFHLNFSGETSVSDVNVTAPTSSPTTQLSRDNHTHRFNANVSSTNNNPRYINVILAMYNSTNAAPTHNNPTFNPSPPVITTNLTCLNQSTSDLNKDDLLFNIYNWEFNDSGGKTVSLANFSLPFDTNTTNLINNITNYADYSKNATVGEKGTTPQNANNVPLWVSPTDTRFDCYRGSCYFFDRGGSGIKTGPNHMQTIRLQQTLLSDINFTISVWINTTKTAVGSTAATILDIYENDCYGIIRLEAQGNVSFYAHNVSAFQSITSKTALNDSKWHNIVVTKTSCGSGGSGSCGADQMAFNISMWLDGVFVNSKYIGITRSTCANCNGPTIGGLCTTGLTDNRTFNGTIDEFIYIPKFVPAEAIIAQYYNAGSIQPNVTSSQLLLNNQNVSCCVTPTDTINDGDRKCVSELVGDVPYFTSIQTNQTTIRKGQWINFSAILNDGTSLTGGVSIFSINQTGNWVNASFVSAQGGTSGQISNVTNITANRGTTVEWRFHANDSSNDWNQTPLQSFIVANTPPIHNNPTYNPSSPLTNSNLTCLNQSTSDYDSDRLYNIYNWEFDDSGGATRSLAIFNLPFNTNTSSLLSNITNYGNYSVNATVGETSASVQNVNNVPLWTNGTISGIGSGYLGAGYWFNKSSGRLKVIRLSQNDVSKLNFTISLWINATNSTITSRTDDDAQQIFSDNCVELRLEEGGYGIFLVDNITNYQEANSTVRLSDSKWHHILVQKTSCGNAACGGGSPIYNISIWVDGVQRDSKQIGPTNTNCDTCNGPTIGAYCYGNNGGGTFVNRTFNGTIDEFIYIPKFVPAEAIIAQYYNAGSIQPNVTSSGLLKNNQNVTCCVIPSDLSDDGDRKCVSALVSEPDNPPYFTLNQTNQSTIRKGQWINFSEVLTDGTSLTNGGYIFSINQTGNWVNSSFTLISSGTNVTIYNVTNITANRGTRVEWRFYANDSSNNWNQSILHYFTVSNTAPGNTTLLTPANASSITNRQPNFTWQAVTDFDTNDNVIYNLYVSKFVDFSSLDIVAYNISNASYISTTELGIGGGSQKYFWKIETYDNTSFGENSSTFEFTITSEVSISLNVSFVSFGTLNPGDRKNTTTSDPESLVVQNDGNTYINVNISALDSLWDAVGLGTIYFQYAAGNYTGETPAFNWSGSTTTFTNVPTSNTTFIDYLNYTNATDLARIHLLIRVPNDEPSGNKSSTLVIGAQLGE